MDHPTLLPDPSGQGLEQVGRIALEALTKEGAVVIGQGMDVDEELGTAGDPPRSFHLERCLTSIWKGIWGLFWQRSCRAGQEASG